MIRIDVGQRRVIAHSPLIQCSENPDPKFDEQIGGVLVNESFNKRHKEVV
jgi:hypothetical protein